VLDYSRGPAKTWIYGALRPADGQAVTHTAPSRTSAGYQQLLATVETAGPAGTIVVITDNLSSHNKAAPVPGSWSIRASARCSSPKGPAGSTLRRAGGGPSLFRR
jgi:hypothetical protein